MKEQVDINIKYDGYIKRQMRQVEQFKKLENKRIPENIDYDSIQSLRLEAKQKLNQIRPASIGQASRISGVSPADISVLLVYLGSKYKIDLYYIYRIEWVLASRRKHSFFSASGE